MGRGRDEPTPPADDPDRAPSPDIAPMRIRRARLSDGRELILFDFDDGDANGPARGAAGDRPDE